MHIVPKYEGKENWGSTFEMNPGKTYLTEEEYNNMIETIKRAL
jgi:diadenosine tetraphosphate (Ap4A) HIT family hydrolase